MVAYERGDVDRMLTLFDELGAKVEVQMAKTLLQSALVIAKTSNYPFVRGGWSTGDSGAGIVLARGHGPMPEHRTAPRLTPLAGPHHNPPTDTVLWALPGQIRQAGLHLQPQGVRRLSAGKARRRVRSGGRRLSSPPTPSSSSPRRWTNTAAATAATQRMCVSSPQWRRWRMHGCRTSKTCPTRPARALPPTR